MHRSLSAAEFKHRIDLAACRELPVIPDIKLMDLGLIDVTRFDFMEVSAADSEEQPCSAPH